MESPPTIKEDGTRWTVENARPLGLRIGWGVAAPIVLALLGYASLGDVRDGKWVMLAMRAVFAVFVVTAAVFSLFGGETLAVADGEVTWQRGRKQIRRAKLADVEKLERTGTQLRVHVRGEEQPIIVGAGLRQPPAAMSWLMKRLDAAIIAARKGT
jgi:hypothetical protein